jgi:hypothetical protein
MSLLYELAKERKTEIIGKYGGRNLARLLNISHPAVSKWQVIPPLRAYQIADLGDFDLDYIRPDLKHEIAPQPQGVDHSA